MPSPHSIAAALILTVALPAGGLLGAEAAEDPAPSGSLYRLDPTPRLPREGLLAVPGAAEEFALSEAHAELVAEDSDHLTLALPSGLTLEAVRTRFVEYRDDWKSWTGMVRVAGTGDLATGYIYLGSHGDRLTGLIDFRDERYRIVAGATGDHRLVRLSDDPETFPCGTEARAVADGARIEHREQPIRPLAAAPAEARGTAGAIRAKGSPTRLDVLAVFPRAYFAFPASLVSLIDFVEDSIALANDAFANSDIDAYYNLVYVGPLVGAQPPSTGLVDGWDWLNTDPSEVVALRNAFGADIVALFIPFIWNDDPYCGVANLPYANGTHSGTTQPFAQRAFSVNRDGCGLGDFTLGHEIGHNYGMRHGDDTTSSVHLFPFGRGHSLTSLGKSTVMSCTCSGSCPVGTAAICNRIPYFSDPNISYLGISTGEKTRKNAVVGRTQVGPYSAFRAVSSNTPPNASFTVSCNSSGTCTFDASGSSDDTTIPSGGYHWDFGDGQTGSGQTVNHTYSSGSFYWVFLVVTDSGGQEDYTLEVASF